MSSHALSGDAATRATCPWISTLELRPHLRVWEFKAVCNVQLGCRIQFQVDAQSHQSSLCAGALLLLLEPGAQGAGAFSLGTTLASSH